MNGGGGGPLIRVKSNPLRQPAILGAGMAALVALLVLNVVAFVRGMDAPWLLGGVILSDMLVIGVGVLVAAREVVMAEHGTALAEAELLAIVEWSDDAMVSKSLDGTIRSWNRGAERMFGYSAAQAVGRHISLIIP